MQLKDDSSGNSVQFDTSFNVIKSIYFEAGPFGVYYQIAILVETFILILLPYQQEKVGNKYSICEREIILKAPYRNSLRSLIGVSVGLSRFHLVEPPFSPLSSHSNFDSSVFTRSSSFRYFYPFIFSFFNFSFANLKECERPAPPAGYEDLTVAVGSVPPSQVLFFVFCFLLNY